MADLEWYRSFVAIYRAGTVSAASKARYLTQPAVSQHLAALESMFKRALFRRTPRRMIPTEHGHALYQRVAAAVETLEHATRRSQHNDLRPATLRLGAPLEYFYERALGKLARLPFRYHLEFGIAERLIEKLDRAGLDLVIATQQVPSQTVEFRKIEEESFVLVGPPTLTIPGGLKNPSADPARLADWLRAQPWISYAPELPLIRRYWQHLFKTRPPFEPAHIIPNLHAIQRAVELGAGISVLPEYLCRDRIKQRALKRLHHPKHPVMNDLWLAYRKLDRHLPGVEAVLGAMSR